MKKLIRLNAAIVASLVTSQPFLFAYQAKAQNTVKPPVYSLDQWASMGANPATAQPTTGAAKSVAGTWNRNALSFGFSNSGCIKGNQPTETSLVLSELGGVISVIGKSNSATQGGRISGNQFSLKDSSNGLTLEYVGILNAAGNEITGSVTCRSAIGSGTSVQSFTLKLQPAVVPQVNFTPSAIRETSTTSFQVDLTGSDGTKATIFYRRLNGKVFQEEIHIMEINKATGSYNLASKLKFSPDGSQVEVQTPNSRESMLVTRNANKTVTLISTDQFGQKQSFTSQPYVENGQNAIAYPTGLCKAIDDFCSGVQKISNVMLLPDLVLDKLFANPQLKKALEKVTVFRLYSYLKAGLNISSLGCWIIKGGIPPLPVLKSKAALLYGLAGAIADKAGVKFPAIETVLAKLRKEWGLDFCDRDSITVTIQGPTTLKEGQSTIVRVEYQSLKCLASEVTIYGPISHSRVTLPTTSSCSGKVDFKVFPKKGSSSGGCRLNENTFAAFVPRVTPGKVISPPVTVSRHPGQFDYFPCYAEITK
jgi:hypothetical protein